MRRVTNAFNNKGIRYNDYLHPLTIGDVELKNNIILGPMAGVSDLPFRLLCHEMGAGLVCMEMVSAKAIYYNNKNTDLLMEIAPEEDVFEKVLKKFFKGQKDVRSIEIIKNLRC